MKRLLTLLLCILILTAFVIPASAAGNKVVDNVGLLTTVEAAYLNDQAQQTAETYQMDVVIVTVESLGGKTAQEYADDYFDNNGYGYGADASGILLLVAMNEREWAVSTCGETIQVISNSEIDVMMVDVLPYLSAGDYADAFDEFLTEVAYEYEAGIEPPNYVLRFVVALVIGAIVALIALLIMRGSMNTARAQDGAGDYMVPGSYELYRCQDIYLYSHTTRVKKEENNGSGTHSSSSGRSHGGSSGRF